MVQVLHLVSGHLTAVQQISYILKGGAGVTYDPTADTLTVKASHYTRSDAHCCPSQVDIITFQWDGRAFVQQRLETVPLDSGKP
jgi:hypothetical protein